MHTEKCAVLFAVFLFNSSALFACDLVEFLRLHDQEDYRQLRTYSASSQALDMARNAIILTKDNDWLYRVREADSLTSKYGNMYHPAELLAYVSHKGGEHFIDNLSPQKAAGFKIGVHDYHRYIAMAFFSFLARAPKFTGPAFRMLALKAKNAEWVLKDHPIGAEVFFDDFTSASRDGYFGDVEDYGEIYIGMQIISTDARDISYLEGTAMPENEREVVFYPHTRLKVLEHRRIPAPYKFIKSKDILEIVMQQTE